MLLFSFDGQGSSCNGSLKHLRRAATKTNNNKNTSQWWLILAKTPNPKLMPLSFESFKSESKILLLSFPYSSPFLPIPQCYLSIAPWITNEKFWGLLSTIHFHSRAASQPRNLGNCHVLVKLTGVNCTQINNFISKMLLGLGKDKNPILNVVYWIENFNSLLHLLVCSLKSSVVCTGLLLLFHD